MTKIVAQIKGLAYNATLRQCDNHDFIFFLIFAHENVEIEFGSGSVIIVRVRFNKIQKFELVWSLKNICTSSYYLTFFDRD